MQHAISIGGYRCTFSKGGQERYCSLIPDPAVDGSHHERERRDGGQGGEMVQKCSSVAC